MNSAEAAKGRWEQIYAALDLPPLTGGKHWQGECPICRSKGKFRFHNRYDMGDWICVCGSGDGFELIMARDRLSFPEAAKRVDEITGRTADAAAPREPTQAEIAASAFKLLPKLEGTLASGYLAGRRIHVMPESGVRFAKRRAYHEDGKEAAKFPALVALAADERGRAIYQHTTFIDGEAKAGVSAPRKLVTLTEYSGSCAVRLFKAGRSLGIAEGIETALSATQLYKTPTWATLNASIMERFKAPAGVEELRIFADNDAHGRGLAAAFTCAYKNLLYANQVRSVVIKWPSYVNDFNDLLVSCEEVFECKVLTREK